MKDLKPIKQAVERASKQCLIPNCGKTGMSERQYYYHLKTKHDNYLGNKKSQSHKHHCTNCEKGYAQKRQLDKHLLVCLVKGMKDKGSCKDRKLKSPNLSTKSVSRYVNLPSKYNEVSSLFADQPSSSTQQLSFNIGFEQDKDYTSYHSNLQNLSSLEQVQSDDVFHKEASQQQLSIEHPSLSNPISVMVEQEVLRRLQAIKVQVSIKIDDNEIAKTNSCFKDDSISSHPVVADIGLDSIKKNLNQAIELPIHNEDNACQVAEKTAEEKFSSEFKTPKAQRLSRVQREQLYEESKEKFASMQNIQEVEQIHPMILAFENILREQFNLDSQGFIDSENYIRSHSKDHPKLLNSQNNATFVQQISQINTRVYPELFQILAEKAEMNQSSLFYDIKSQFGRAAFYCAILQQTSAMTLVENFEIKSNLFKIKQRLLMDFKKSFNSDQLDALMKLEIQCDSFVNRDLRMKNHTPATHLCCFETNFADDQLEELAQMINESDSIQYILWIYDPSLTLNAKKLKGFLQVSSYQIPQALDGQDVTFYLYKRDYTKFNFKSFGNTPNIATSSKKILSKRKTPEPSEVVEQEDGLPRYQTSDDIHKFTPKTKAKIAELKKNVSNKLIEKIVDKQNMITERNQRNIQKIEQHTTFEHFESLCKLAQQIFFQLTGKRVIELQSFLKSLNSSNFQLGRFHEEQKVIENIENIAQITGWIGLFSTRQVRHIKRVKELQFSEIKELLQEHFKLDIQTIRTHKPLDVFEEQKKHELELRSNVDKLKSYWCRTKVDRDNLQLVYNKISNVIDLPRAPVLERLEITKEEQQQIQSFIKSDPELASLTDAQKKMFADGSQFFVHYKKHSQMLTIEVQRGINKLIEGYKKTQDLQQQVNKLHQEAEQMILVEAVNQGVKDPEKMSDSLLAKAFKCKYLDEDKRNAQMQSDLMLKVFEQDASNEMRAYAHNYKKHKLNVNDHSIKIIQDFNILGRIAILMPIHRFNMMAFLQSHEVSIEQFRTIFYSLAKVLVTAHQRGIFHLNLKPENVLFNDYNDFCLTDWGLDQNLRDHHIDQYTPPEVVRKSYKRQHYNLSMRDSWGFGILVYYFMYKELPYSIDDLKSLEDDESTLPGLPIGNPQRETNKSIHAIKCLLKADPLERMSLSMIIDSQYL